MNRRYLLALAFPALLAAQKPPIFEIRLTGRPPEWEYDRDPTKVFVQVMNVSNHLAGFMEADKLDTYGIIIRRADRKKVNLTKDGILRRVNEQAFEPKDGDERSFRPFDLPGGANVIRAVSLAGLVDFSPGTYVVELRKEPKAEREWLVGERGTRSIPARRVGPGVEIVVGEDGKVKR